MITMNLTTFLVIAFACVVVGGLLASPEKFIQKEGGSKHANN
jgi:hypothetical protein